MEPSQSSICKCSYFLGKQIYFYVFIKDTEVDFLCEFDQCSKI